MLTQAAIMCRKAELAVEQQQLQAVLDAGIHSGMDPLDQPDIPQDIKVRLNFPVQSSSRTKLCIYNDQPVWQWVLLCLQNVKSAAKACISCEQWLHKCLQCRNSNKAIVHNHIHPAAAYPVCRRLCFRCS